MESPENGGACFPPFPQTLEIEKADFHIPSAPGRDDEYNSSFKTRKDKNPASPTLRFLQAHPWIGKDYWGWGIRNLPNFALADGEGKGNLSK